MTGYDEINTVQHLMKYFLGIGLEILQVQMKLIIFYAMFFYFTEKYILQLKSLYVKNIVYLPKIINFLWLISINCDIADSFSAETAILRNFDHRLQIISPLSAQYFDCLSAPMLKKKKHWSYLRTSDSRAVLSNGTGRDGISNVVF